MSARSQDVRIRGSNFVRKEVRSVIEAQVKDKAAKSYIRVICGRKPKVDTCMT